MADPVPPRRRPLFVARRREAALALSFGLALLVACASVRRAGTGDVSFRLLWDGRSDIDLHVRDPSGEELSFGHRVAASGGILDVDCNGAFDRVCKRPIENVFWPTGRAPIGTYRYWAQAYAVLPDEAPVEVHLLVLEGTEVVRDTEVEMGFSGQRAGPFEFAFGTR